MLLSAELMSRTVRKRFFLLRVYWEKTVDLFILFIGLFVHFKGIDTLPKEATLSKLFCLRSETGSALKGQKLLHWEQILSF